MAPTLITDEHLSNTFYNLLKTFCIKSKIIKTLLNFQLIDENSLKVKTNEILESFYDKYIINDQYKSIDNEDFHELLYEYVYEIIQIWFPFWIDIDSYSHADDIDLEIKNIFCKTYNLVI